MTADLIVWTAAAALLALDLLAVGWLVNRPEWPAHDRRRVLVTGRHARRQQLPRRLPRPTMTTLLEAQLLQHQVDVALTAWAQLAAA